MQENFGHYSVLLNETVDSLNIKPDGVYVDCTLGGAGHSNLIASRLSEKGRLIGIDRDEFALGKAKERLAYEVTAIVHGKEIADEVLAKVRAAFSGDVENMPELVLDRENARLIDILAFAKIAPSKGEARRLIEGGGIKIDEDKVSDVNFTVTAEMMDKGFVLHKGKKVHYRVKFN